MWLYISHHCQWRGKKVLTAHFLKTDWPSPLGRLMQHNLSTPFPYSHFLSYCTKLNLVYIKNADSKQQQNKKYSSQSHRERERWERYWRGTDKEAWNK